MSILKVEGLRKSYPSFTLGELSFSLEEGKITGLIGINGAGKSTLMDSIFGLVHRNGGQIEIFNRLILDDDASFKRKIGYVSSGLTYYQEKRLRVIKDVIRRFYDNWDDSAYDYYLSYFELDSNKRFKDLSNGMKIKFSLVLSLSHNAELLILDEPTSGLDPLSRDELLAIFLDLKE